MLEDSPGYQELIARGEAKGLEIGKEIGEALALRRAVLGLLSHRLEQLPEQLPTRLEALGAAELQQLFDQVLAAQDSAAVEAVLTARFTRS